MKMNLKTTLLAVTLAVAAASCVPSRMHDELKAKKMLCEEENARLKAEALEYTTKKAEMEQLIKDIQRDNGYLRNDTAVMGQGNRRLTQLYNELSDSYEKLGQTANAVLFGENLIPENPGTTVRIGDEVEVLETRRL